MTLLDWIIIGVVGFFTVMGFLSGFKKKFFGKIVRIGAIIVAFLFASRVAAWIEPTELGQTIINWVPSVGKYILLAITGIAIALVVVLFFKIIGTFIKRGDEDKSVGIVDRIFGLLFGLIKGVFLIQGLMVAAILLTKIPFLESTINEFLEANNAFATEGFSFTRYAYQFGNSIIEYFSQTVAAGILN